MGAIKLLAGKEVEVVSVAGGWSSIIDHDGKNRKVRNGQLSDAVAKVEVKLTKVNAAKAAAAIQPRRIEKAKATDTEVVATKEFLINPDMTRYEIGLGKTVSGRRTVDINDGIAARFRGLSIEDVYESAARILRLDAQELIAEYKHLNIGMQRMNLGNRCRAVLTNRAKSEKAE